MLRHTILGIPISRICKSAGFLVAEKCMFVYAGKYMDFDVGLEENEFKALDHQVSV